MSDEQQERKQINFTIVPDEQPGDPRTYANFCSIAHTPFDFTLTFCEVMPLSEKEVRDAASAAAFGYFANSARVTMFTRASVDCADSIVATSNSNALR